MTVRADTAPISWWRKTAAFGVVMLAVVLVNLPSLLRTAPPDGACGSARPLLGPFVRFQNCDSHVFNLIAADWTQLFAPAGETRLGRPVFLTAGWLMDRLLYVGSFGALDPSTATAPYFEAAEPGYILINVIIVAAAIVVALGLMFGRGWQQWLLVKEQWLPAAFIFLLLAVNPVTKAFIWTSHTQMFAMLIPVVALAVCAWALRSDVRPRTALWVGILIGLGVLAYATSIVVALSAATALLIRRRVVSSVLVLVGAAGLPALWVLGVWLTHGSFYSVETEKFRQFVWVLDGMSDGSLLEKIRSNVDGFLRSLFEGQTLLALVIVIVTVLAIAFISRISPGAPQPHLTSVAVATGIVGGWYVVFLYAMGFYQTRLSWGLVVLAITATGVLLAATLGNAGNAAKRTVQVVLIALLVVWVGAWIAIPDPWF